MFTSSIDGLPGHGHRDPWLLVGEAFSVLIRVSLVLPTPEGRWADKARSDFRCSFDRISLCSNVPVVLKLSLSPQSYALRKM